MLSELAKKMSSYYIQKKVIKEGDKDIYDYSFEVLIATVINLSIVLVIAIITDSLLYSICYLIGFAAVRVNAGGAHAHSHFSCIVIFELVYAINLLIAKTTTENMQLYVAVPLLVVGNGIIIKLSPVEDYNKQLTIQDKLKFKKKSIISTKQPHKLYQNGWCIQLKKVYQVLSICILLLGISGCSRVSNIEQNSETDTSTISSQEESFNFANQAVGYSIKNTTWEEENIIYTGNTLKESFEISSEPVSAEFGLLVYVNGMLTPYYTDEEDELNEMHTFKTLDNSQNRNINVYFKPINGKNGEAYSLDIILLDNPDYMIKDITWVSFTPNLSILNICRKTIEYRYDDKDINLSNNYEMVNLPSDIELLFSNDYSTEGNELNDTGIWFDLCAGTFDYTNKCFLKKDYFSVNSNEQLKVFIPILGKGGDYILSFYINNQLVNVFDGEKYLNVIVKRDKYCEKEVEIAVNEYEGYNQMYIIAVNKNTHEVIKSNTYLLEIKE